MQQTIGIFAPVDSGKTTFTERLLYHTGRIRSMGSVDDGTAAMDYSEIERSRGITVFTGQSSFDYAGDTYHIIDTPGHTDFSPEAERAMQAVDLAVLLISGSDGVTAQSRTLFRLLGQYGIPVLFFISKTDLPDTDTTAVLQELRQKLTDDVLSDSGPAACAQFAAERDEVFLECYLSEAWTETALEQALVRLVRQRLCFPAVCGSARTGEGIGQFLHTLQRFACRTEDTASLPLSATVYKVRYDDKGARVAFLKINAGTLRARQEFTFLTADGPVCEKVGELRLYHGQKYQTVPSAAAGQLIGVTGLHAAICGTALRADAPVPVERYPFHLSSALQAQLIVQDDTDSSRLSQTLRLLEDEDPALAVSWQASTGRFLVHVMGAIQLEVLEYTLRARFGIDASFAPPQVEYRETIASPVLGFGHFEPLRHYAEVQLRLEPAPRGSGIVFASECPVDCLTQNYQHLVETHVSERAYPGVLTGAPLTDVRIVLLDGRSHVKHTEGGDFREATCRAIRQGLRKAQSVLLEPFYRMEFFLPEDTVGRVLSDVIRLRGTFSPPETLPHAVHLCVRGPVATFLSYPQELTAFTRGQGSVSMAPDGYDLCEDADAVIGQIGYDADRDSENPSSSVFCAKGAGYSVPWQEAEQLMHTLHK